MQRLPRFFLPPMKPCATCNLRPRQDSTNRSQKCYCKECWSSKSSKWNSKHKEHKRDYELKRKFGVSLEEYNVKLAAQGGLCAICRESNSDRRSLAQDHNHETKQPRGLLCGNCNRGIGNLRDSPAVLQRAIEYLNLYAHRPAGK